MPRRRPPPAARTAPRCGRAGPARSAPDRDARLRGCADPRRDGPARGVRDRDATARGATSAATRATASSSCAASAGPVRMSSGLELVASRAARDVRGPIDTLFVAGGEGVRARRARRATIDWIRRMDARARRDRRACARARSCSRARGCSTAAARPRTGAAAPRSRGCSRASQVEPDRIYVRDGRIATSAGVTAGMDLALALLEDDLGGELARDVARQLVLFLRRPGGQSQFSVAAREPRREPALAARAAGLDPRASRRRPRRRGARAAHGR